MIKCKEDLLNTYIRTDDINLIKLYIEKLAEYGLHDNNLVSALDYIEHPSPYCDYLFCKEVYPVAQWSREEHLPVRELTLADFKEENKQPVSKYKYTPLEVESIFELKEPLEKGKLFYGKPDNMKKILHEWGLMKVIVEDEFRIHLLEEVNWKEQISEEYNFTYIDKEDSFVQMGCTSSEDMIKFAKRVLELSGELK